MDFGEIISYQIDKCELPINCSVKIKSVVIWDRKMLMSHETIQQQSVR